MMEANQLLAEGYRKEALELQMEAFYSITDEAKHRGWRLAGEILEHYMRGSGGRRIIDASQIKCYLTTHEKVVSNLQRFIFTDAINYQYLNIPDALSQMKNGQTIQYKDYYEDVVENISQGRSSGDLDFETEISYALGNFTLKSTANFSVSRKGEKFFLSGTIDQQAFDVYDWEGIGAAVNIFGVTINDQQMEEMKEIGAKSFKIENTVWSVRIKEGSYILRNTDGTYDYSNVTLIFE